MNNLSYEEELSSLDDSYVHEGEVGECVPTNTTMFKLHPSTTSTHIPERAFRACASLTNVEIPPNTITEIGRYAFEGCDSLTNFTIPNSVQTIGGGAFYECSSLTSIKLPHGITIIPNHAFYGCSSLATVDIANTVVKIGDGAFYKCVNLINIDIPKTVKKIGPGAFRECSSLTSINLPHGITIIHDSTFKECSSLITIQISNSVAEIGKSAFYECRSLRSLIMPSSIQKIGIHAFSGCENLNSMKLPPNVNNFPNCLFCGLQNEVYISDGPGPQYGFKGATQCNYGPEKCGITLDQIKQLGEHPSIVEDETTTMRDVVQNVIKPATKNSGIGYALMINQNKPLHTKVMVSHAWDERFLDFVTALERSGHKGPFWVCALSIYQSDGDHDLPTIADQLGPDPDYGPFATVLKAADLMMAVITDRCDIYSRLWCVFELHTARRLKKQVELRPFIGVYDEQDGKVQKDICVSNISTFIDCKNAFCWNDNDRKSIHEAITKEAHDGFKDVNQAVELIRLEYLLNYPIENIIGGDRWSDQDIYEMICMAFLVQIYFSSMIIPFRPVGGMQFVASGVMSCIYMAVVEKWNFPEQWIHLLMQLVIPILALAVTLYFHYGIFFGIGSITPIIVFMGLRHMYENPEDDFFSIGQRTVINKIQILFDNKTMPNRKEAAAKLSKAVEAVYLRVGDIRSSEIVLFDSFCKSNKSCSILYDRFPLMAYFMWTRHVTRQLTTKINTTSKNQRKKNEVKNSAIQRSAIDSAVLESTPLLV